MLVEYTNSNSWICVIQRRKQQLVTARWFSLDIWRFDLNFLTLKERKNAFLPEFATLG